MTTIDDGPVVLNYIPDRRIYELLTHRHDSRVTIPRANALDRLSVHRAELAGDDKLIMELHKIIHLAGRTPHVQNGRNHALSA